MAGSLPPPPLHEISYSGLRKARVPGEVGVAGGARVELPVDRERRELGPLQGLGRGRRERGKGGCNVGKGGEMVLPAGKMTVCGQQISFGISAPRERKTKIGQTNKSRGCNPRPPDSKIGAETRGFHSLKIKPAGIIGRAYQLQPCPVCPKAKGKATAGGLQAPPPRLKGWWLVGIGIGKANGKSLTYLTSFGKKKKNSGLPLSLKNGPTIFVLV